VTTNCYCTGSGRSDHVDETRISARVSPPLQALIPPARPSALSNLRRNFVSFTRRYISGRVQESTDELRLSLFDQRTTGVEILRHGARILDCVHRSRIDAVRGPALASQDDRRAIRSARRAHRRPRPATDFRLSLPNARAVPVRRFALCRIALIYMGPRAEDDAHIAFTIISLCQGGIWLNDALSWGLEEFIEVHREPQNQEGLATAVSAVRFLSRLAVWSIVILLVLSNLHINVTTLVAGLGVGGVAVALALQNILGDLFASLSIMLDKPFAIGHFIVVDNLTGTVEYVGVKTTRIRSIDGEELIISNSDLLKSRIHN
jgi:hypothetical protein